MPGQYKSIREAGLSRRKVLISASPFPYRPAEAYLEPSQTSTM